MVKFPIRLALAIAVAFPGVFGIRDGVAEESTVRAMMTWEGKSSAARVAENTVMLVAIIEGAMFVDGNKGRLHSARILCPVTATISPDLSQTVRGRCSITDVGGDLVFGRFACKGELFKGCRGVFTLIGGTGKYKSIKGGGPVVFLSTFGDLRNVATGISRGRTIGLANFPEFKIRTPKQR